MNTLIRRTAVPRLARHALSRPSVSPLLFLKSRTVASSVSNRPASQTFQHTATNIKEEAGNAASDVAKIIAGSNVTRQDVVTPNNSTFVRESVLCSFAWTHNEYAPVWYYRCYRVFCA